MILFISTGIRFIRMPVFMLGSEPAGRLHQGSVALSKNKWVLGKKEGQTFHCARIPEINKLTILYMFSKLYEI